MPRQDAIRLIGTWVSRWGFAFLVALAATTAAIVGATVAIPANVPGVALQAAPVYRLEVGGAIFVGLYVVAMAMVLAFHNRGFTEIGTGGVRAESLARIPRAFAAEETSFATLRRAIGELKRLQEVEEGE